MIHINANWWATEIAQTDAFDVEYEGMTKIICNFNSIEEFTRVSIELVNSGAMPEESIVDVQISDLELEEDILFGCELFNIFESADYTTMQVVLYGYYREDDDYEASCTY